MLNLVEENQRKDVDWLKLPNHILTVISNKLINVRDYIRFGVVCHSWKCVYTENLPYYSPPTQPPLLMFCTEDEADHDIKTFMFYCLSERRTGTFRSLVPNNMVCRSSTHGWLLIMDKYLINSNFLLVNPFLLVNNKIELPPFFVEGNSVSNMVLSANPATSTSYAIMAIYDNYKRLAFFKSGERTWTPVKDFNNVPGLIENVIYCDDRFYAVDCNGVLFECHVSHPHPKLLRVAPSIGATPDQPWFSLIKIYLAEASGKVLQVRRQVIANNTNRFEVFRLDSVGSKWVEVKSLDGRVLFLGDNSSICLNSSDFPGCKPNCIYFTDDVTFRKTSCYILFSENVYDTGVFNVEDGTFDRYCPIKLKKKFPAPIWIEPTLPH